MCLLPGAEPVSTLSHRDQSLLSIARILRFERASPCSLFGFSRREVKIQGADGWAMHVIEEILITVLGEYQLPARLRLHFLVALVAGDDRD